MRARDLGVIGGCGALLIGLSACSNDKEESSAMAMARPDGPPPAVLTGEYWMDHEEFGPPPPGYVKIVGEPMPNWEPGGLGLASNPMQWSPLGPQPIVDEFWSGPDEASGRVVSIAPHPQSENIVYIASASGGVWKTVDQGENWIPLTDELSILNHGVVAVDPNNPTTVYAGTGEYTTGSSGDGIFRSLDEGATWERAATIDQVGVNCSGLAVAPGNSLLLHHTGAAGYSRSVDGGLTWNIMLDRNVSSLALHPTDPNVLYVAVRSDGVYRSDNGGLSFVRLGSGLPSDGAGHARIVIALAKSDPNRLYAAYVRGSNIDATYATSNGGDSWTELLNAPNFARPQAWYDTFIAVDPADKNIVYAGGVFPTYGEAGVTRTLDGGATWNDVTYGTSGASQVHPDQHFLTFGPTGIIWLGNDGGVWKSTDNVATWIDTNATLTVTQNYNISLHPTDPNRVIGGTQDNGTVERQIDDPDWPQILAGDGGFSAYDFDEPDIRHYATYVYLAVYRQDDNGTDQISGPWGGDPKNFIAPLVMDPNDAKTLLGGTNRIWRTRTADTTANWTAISTSEVGSGGTINAIAVAMGNSNIIYTGNRGGGIWRTIDGENWENLTDNNLFGGSVSDIFINPKDSDNVYATFYDTSGARVIGTNNGGQSWTDYTGELPVGVSARALEVDWNLDPPTLFVGSGHGVYVSFDLGEFWVKDGNDLPNVNIGDLAIDFANNTITAGTYGRGAWRSPLPNGLGCDADIDGDGDVDAEDFFGFLDLFANGEPGADIDEDGDIDADDFFGYLDLFAQGCG